MKVFSKLNIFIIVLVIFSLLTCFCQSRYEGLTNKDTSSKSNSSSSTISQAQALHNIRQSQTQHPSGMYAGLSQKADLLPKSLNFDITEEQILLNDEKNEDMVEKHDLEYTNSFNNTDNSTKNMKLFSKNSIPAGDEHLYVLKSQIVPPVCPACPACPDLTSCEKGKKPQPCPPCARCPEPAFECKKVPNYSSTNDNYLPIPILNDFSQFSK